MRFLRILPAVCAIISCPFSSFTRNVALGRSSLTVPGNSSSSSLAIRPLVTLGGRENAPKPRKSKAPGEPLGWEAPLCITRPLRRKPCLDAPRQLVPDRAIGQKALVPRALDRRRIERRPIFDLCRRSSRQFHRLVVRLRRQR